MSDPEVQNMNDTQWLFELEGLYVKEEQRIEEIKVLSKVFKKAVVDLLGLNLLPVEEQIPIEDRDPEYLGAIGEEEVYTRLRHPEEHEIIPLAILMGREEMVAEIIKRQKELYEQEDLDRKEEAGDLVHMTPEELEAFMDEDDGDLDFIEDSAAREKRMIWESEEYQKMNAALVQPMTSKDDDPILQGKDSPVVSEVKGKKSRVTLE